MLHQRTLRHDLFSQTAVSVAGAMGDSSKRKFRLRSVDSLLGTTTRASDVVVLGMLTQVKHGTFSLEDPTGVVTLDMTETKFHTGIYTESSFVLAEGW
jgi:DNA polymerase epsilon subunit 2